MTESTGAACVTVGCSSGVIFRVVDGTGQALTSYVVTISFDGAPAETYRCNDDGRCAFERLALEGFPRHISGSVEANGVVATFDSDVEYSATMTAGPYCPTCVAANVLVIFR